MHVGVVAFNVLKAIPASDSRSLGILLTGYMFQGDMQRCGPMRHANSLHRAWLFDEFLLYWNLPTPVCIFVILWESSEDVLIAHTTPVVSCTYVSCNNLR